MKKLFSAIFVCLSFVLTISMAACGDGKSGTYYPASDEMKSNLEKVGYTVVVTTDLGDRKGTHLSATKAEEYIEVYWLENEADGDYFYEKVKKDFPNYTAAAEILNDETFGNLVYCGTVAAVEDAGIKTVVTKVKV